MKLSDLLKNIKTISIEGDTDIEIKGLSMDSRKIVSGGIFFAVPGENFDGHNFIDDAITYGASVIVCEKVPENTHVGVVYIKVERVQDVIGLMASEFFDNPSEKLRVVGVTGTNGKTTVATMLYKLFEALGEKSGLLSTIENRVGDTVVPATHTTADPIILQENLAEMVKQNCRYTFMEVSSHSLVQGRVKGVNFTGAIFTNLSQDHLDYHKTMEEYAKAKKIFFDDLSGKAFALYNADDEYGKFMVSDSRGRIYSYGKGDSDFNFEIKESSPKGLKISIGESLLESPLVGEFNAYNLASIYAAARLLDKEGFAIKDALKSISGVRGRMEKIENAKDIFAIVDYAHTPDALKNALETINSFKGDAKIVTLFGCGGDRDKTKRPIMGQIAEDLSDIVVVTSDNPRTEDPQSIIDDILVGIKDKENTFVELDRKSAIEKAVSLAKQGDIILVAGKGHEEYQIIENEKKHFSDKEVLIEVLK